MLCQLVNDGRAVPGQGVELFRDSRRQLGILSRDIFQHRLKSGINDGRFGDRNHVPGLARPGGRSPGSGRFKGHPAQIIEGDLCPLVGLVRLYRLGLVCLGNGPARDHPGRNPHRSRQHDESGAELPAGTLPAAKEEPVRRVLATLGLAVARVGKSVGVPGPQKRLQGFGLQVGGALSLGDLQSQVPDPLGQVIGQLGIGGVAGHRGLVQLAGCEGRDAGGPGELGQRRVTPKGSAEGPVGSRGEDVLGVQG